MTVTALPAAGLRPAQDATRSICVSFAPDARRVEHMRRIAGAFLNRLGGVSEDSAYVVRLLVSELVSNAVQHAETNDIAFTIGDDRSGLVQISVNDHAAAGALMALAPAPGDESGRGLLLVDAFARSWGRDGTETWCVVKVSG
ncbi:ATP-binding protein [Streptomyces sp. NPDC058861]|uniref:ATP-binding protein n=1 Tax=Streptomyces sp. NPDC058861 TaxID=3346653 RepID=UPI00369509FB